MVEDKISQLLFHKPFKELNSKQIDEFYQRRIPVKINGKVVGYYICTKDGRVDRLVHTRRPFEDISG